MFKRLSSLFIPGFFALLLNASTLSWDTTENRIELTPEQEEAKAIFTATNNGKEPVRIDRVKTSCGCTGFILDNKIINPGESSKIVGTFHKGKRQGLNHNKLQVYLEDQSEPIATLHMIVQIPTLVEVQPKIVYWKSNSPKTERSIHLTFDKRYINEIKHIDYNPERITVIKEPAPDNKADFVLRVLPKSFDTALRETIRITTQGAGEITNDTRIHVFVQP